MEKIKYYDNKEEHGIIYDWAEVWRRYHKIIKKAKLSDPVYDPSTAPVNRAKIHVLLSERATGKTTNWLLVGMILNQMYGTEIQYIRSTEDMIAPSVAGNIFNVILSYNEGYYIKAITEGKYSGIWIHWKKAYFCNYDEKGKVTEVAPSNFLQFLSIDKNFDYKSSYNAPAGDLLIWDEAIGKNYRINEFIDFMDLTCTIIRKRKTPIIVILANTINYNWQGFKELEISKEVKQLKPGEKKTLETERGTVIYTEIIALQQSHIKTEINRLFYGFNSPKMASITGSEPWAFDPVPHIVNSDTDEVVNRLFRIDTGDTMLQLDIVKTEDRGLIVNCHECTKHYNDSIIMTLGEIRDNRHIYGVGSKNPYCKMIWNLYELNKWYYDSNETGSLVKSYLKQYRQLKYL